MAYVSHFKHADDVILHLNGIVPTLDDPLLRVKYIGFVTVAAVTVYELAIKEIFIDFARKKHKVLGHVIENKFDRINGRIKLKVIQDEYISMFGDCYLRRFKKLVDSEVKKHFSLKRRDLRGSYANLILWRNDFAHEGKMSTNATYADVVTAYQDCKALIQCIALAMVR